MTKQKRNRPFKDLSGMRFARLTVVKPIERRKNGHTVYACKCDCGSESHVTCSNLKYGHTLSCGCLNRERTSAANRTHGQTNTPLYRVWNQMMDRCYLATAANYKYYGARGIYVEKRWHDFANFIADMGDRPPKAEIDRIDNDGPYSPSNCRWASRSENLRNMSTNRHLTFQGRTMTIAEWSEELHLAQKRISARLSRGWPVERALSPLTKVASRRA